MDIEKVGTLVQSEMISDHYFMSFYMHYSHRICLLLYHCIKYTSLTTSLKTIVLLYQPKNLEKVVALKETPKNRGEKQLLENNDEIQDHLKVTE